jgi:hypothetical protein
MTVEDIPDRWSTPAAASGCYRYEWGDSDRPSMALVDAVAAATDRDQTDLPPLHEFVDVDALNMLMTGQSDDVVGVSLVYDGVAVRIDSAGRIDVQPND